jgi:hypothetical protein
MFEEAHKPKPSRKQQKRDAKLRRKFLPKGAKKADGAQGDGEGEGAVSYEGHMAGRKPVVPSFTGVQYKLF